MGEASNQLGADGTAQQEMRHTMSEIAHKQSDIPDAPWYVVCTDKFMSGWGYAEGKDNVCVFPCRDLLEAERVGHYCLHERDEMIRVRTVRNKPRLRPQWLVSVFNRDDAPAFYGERS